MITTDQIKALREKTGISIAMCKKALEEAGGDEAQALEVLKAAGEAAADKKSDREFGAGAVAAYIHGGTIGALVELKCETDFVAKNPEYRALAEDFAMQVAAMAPADLEELLAMPFIKNPDSTVGDLVKGAIQKFGERVELTRLVRFDVMN
jgi:elongation factor Ts